MPCPVLAMTEASKASVFVEGVLMLSAVDQEFVSASKKASLTRMATDSERTFCAFLNRSLAAMSRGALEDLTSYICQAPDPCSRGQKCILFISSQVVFACSGRRQAKRRKCFWNHLMGDAKAQELTSAMQGYENGHM